MSDPETPTSPAGKPAGRLRTYGIVGALSGLLLLGGYGVASAATDEPTTDSGTSSPDSSPPEGSAPDDPETDRSQPDGRAPGGDDAPGGAGGCDEGEDQADAAT